MHPLTADDFKQLIEQVAIKPRLRRELHFRPELYEPWEDREFAVVTTKSPSKGVLVIPYHEAFAIAPFSLSLRIVDTATGRSRPVICDFCYTWQSGQAAGRITITLPNGTERALLCCGDLACSRHVRGLTQASRMSRAQLSEHLTAEDRIARLRQRLETLVDECNLMTGNLYT